MTQIRVWIHIRRSGEAERGVVTRHDGTAGLPADRPATITLIQIQRV